MTYLGIDLGTSAVKAVLVDEAQHLLASASMPLEVSQPHPHWSEQHPRAWWQATQSAIEQIRSAEPGRFLQLQGIGVSGQMHGAVVLDSELEPLRPAMLWNDTRSHAECVEIEHAVPRSRDISGNLMMPGFTAPKLLWLKQREPETFARICKVMLPKDYIGLCLTGEIVSEMSDASGTGWLDVRQRAWSDELLAATRLDRSHMPRLVEGSDRAGHLRAQLRKHWGISHPVPVAGGAGDNAAAAIGLGAIGSGQALLSLGTSGVLFAGNDIFLPNPADAVHAFCHCLPERWHQMGVILNAASAISWLSRLTGHTPQQLAAEAECSEAHRAPLFLPYLSGERTPHNNADAKGVFFGLTSSHQLPDLAYAVMEGVAFAIADCNAALQKAGTRLEDASFVGGGSRSRFWAQLCASATGIRMLCHGDGDVGGSFGSARLARMAATGEQPGEICTRPEVIASFAPDPSFTGMLHDRWQRYRELYRRLVPHFAT